MAQPPSVPNRDGGSRWLLACGVGCGALLLIVVLGVVSTVMMFQRGMGQMAVEIRTEYANEYKELQEAERIPPEHAEVFDRIFVAAQQNDASFMVTMMGFLVTIGYLEDGEVTETEAESAGKLADFLQDNPDVGTLEFFEFVGENPEFQRAFQDAQRNIDGMGDDWEDGFEEDADFEESDSDAEVVDDSAVEEPESL